MKLRPHTRTLARIRRLCLSFPGTSERLSHGAPTFFIQNTRAFVTYLVNHHGDGRVAVWCAAPPGIQKLLVDGRPDHFFVPAYVGPLGWVGVRLDRHLAWDEIAGVIEDAYLTRAPTRLLSGAARLASGGRAGRAGRRPRGRA